MLSVSASVKVYLYTEAADLRRSYDGLAAIVQEAMGGNPLSGSLFVFVNKRRNAATAFRSEGNDVYCHSSRVEVLPRSSIVVRASLP